MRTDGWICCVMRGSLKDERMYQTYEIKSQVSSDGGRNGQ